MSTIIKRLKSAHVRHLTAGGVARTVAQELAQTVTPQQYGAINNGVYDCSAAIQAANDSGAIALRFPAGVYAARNLIQTIPWNMDAGAFIRYNGATNSDWVVRCTGVGVGGNINIDANGGAPEFGLHVVGSKNNYSRVFVKNMNSPASGNVAGCVKLSGVDNEIGEVVGRDCVNTGQFNVSSPQLLTFGGGADGCQVGRVNGRNVSSGVVNVSSGTSNEVGTINLDGAQDNGIYNTEGKLTVGTIRYKGSDEPVVCIGGDLDVGTVIVESGFNSAIAFTDCGQINIGELILRKSNIEGIMKTRGDNLSGVQSVRIGAIRGELSGASNLLTVDRGLVGYLSVGEIELTYYHTAGKDPAKWAYFTACLGFNIGRVNIRVIDETNALTASDIFRAFFPTAPTKVSYLGEWNIDLVQADGVTASPALSYATNLFAANVQVMRGFLRTNSGPHIEKVNAGIPVNGLFANVAPTVGTWRRGQVLWRAYPSAAGSPGWVCTSGGTPGTWNLMAAVTP